VKRDPLAHPEPLIRKVYSYVAYAIGDGPDAEDVTSETFERALRYRSSFDPAKGSPATWLVGIARRCIADRPRPTAGVDPSELERGEEFHSQRIDALAVRAAVARLPERDRELVALRYGADLTARQIADLLDMQTNAVEVALHRLHGKLRDELAEDFSPKSRKGFGQATGI
jgi:RNA polymerase sigma-70 factor (ECF subfamily)